MSDAIVTQVTNDFIIGGEILLKSLMRHHDISSDVIVLTDPLFSDANKQRLQSIYSNIRFHIISSNQYGETKDNYKGNRVWKINPSDRFELFTFKQYERIYYFDSDILVVKPLPKLFSYQGDFAAAPYSNKISVLSLHKSLNKYDSHLFNAGVMVISNKYLNTSVRDDLVKIAKEKSWTGNQPVLNHYFRMKADLLPASYNVTTESLTERSLSRARILHFVGDKKIWNDGNVRDKFSDDITHRIGGVLLAKLMRVYREQHRILFS